MWLSQLSTSGLSIYPSREVPTIPVQGLLQLVPWISQREGQRREAYYCMSWHYRIRKKVYLGEPWYDIVEYYKLEGASKPCWTVNSMTPGGGTRAEVIENLEQML